MKKILVILEAMTGIGGLLIIGFSFSWWIASAVFLLTFSWNLHEYSERMKFKGIKDY